eukprot:2399296-Pyramimonas_sp.AAC.1
MLYSAIEECKTWPWQTMMVVGRLLANKSGGDRVIGLIAMLCRVWSLAREPCAREWSASLTSSWDAAIAGNSALREAYLRVLESEVAVQLGDDRSDHS